MDMITYESRYSNQNDELLHYGVKGQKWGIRRYQPYPDGAEGKFIGKRQAKKATKALNYNDSLRVQASYGIKKSKDRMDKYRLKQQSTSKERKRLKYQKKIDKEQQDLDFLTNKQKEIEEHRNAVMNKLKEAGYDVSTRNISRSIVDRGKIMAGALLGGPIGATLANINANMKDNKEMGVQYDAKKVVGNDKKSPIQALKERNENLKYQNSILAEIDPDYDWKAAKAAADANKKKDTDVSDSLKARGVIQYNHDKFTEKDIHRYLDAIDKNDKLSKDIANATIKGASKKEIDSIPKSGLTVAVTADQAKKMGLDDSTRITGKAESDFWKAYAQQILKEQKKRR